MLVRLLYASRPAHSVDEKALATILAQAKGNNPALGVTGVLCFCAQAGMFLQVLEGGRNAVNSLYNRIVGDARHRDVVLLAYEEVGERSFAGWSMGQVNMNRLNPAVVLKYSESAQLDPYGLPGAASLALLKELAATASVVAKG